MLGFPPFSKKIFLSTVLFFCKICQHWKIGRSVQFLVTLPLHNNEGLGKEKRGEK